MEAVLASSSVWYQSRACDSSGNGFFAFASRSLVYLLDIRGTAPQHYGILSGHEERVVTCSFGVKGSAGEVYLISGADDGLVKCWDIHTQRVANEHKVHGMNKVVCVHCSPVSNKLVVSGDDKGFIVVWNVETDATQRLMPDGGIHQVMSCLTCSPHYPHLVVVGYKSGAASVIDIRKNGNVIRKLRGHGNEIHSLVWSAFPMEDIYPSNQDTNGQITNEKENFQSIIVTSSKDRTIRLWSLSRGKCLRIIKLPTKPSKGRRISEDTSRLFVALHWPKDSASRFLSSSYNGDVILWDIMASDKDHFTVLSHGATELGHTRIVFNIASGLDPSNTIITTSMDRTIKHWSLEAPESPPTWSLPTLGGFVYSITISPIDPSVIALGIGDGVIRIWRTTNPRNPFDISVMWQGIKEKVMSLAWHPTREGLLAFGTEDGKVGVVDVLSQQTPLISDTYHMKPVYAMSWGPKCYVRSTAVTPADSKICLFTCGGEGVVLMHPAIKMNKEGVNVDDIITATNDVTNLPRVNRTEIAWRRDNDVVAIGNDDGSFDVFRAPYLEIIARVKVHSKIINCLAWQLHSADGEAHEWIASGSNSSIIYVNDMKPILDQVVAAEEQSPEEARTVPVITEPFRTLSGHNGRITDLSWSPHDPRLLVSASYDGTAQVWNVMSEDAIANYRGHDGRLLCVRWRMRMEEEGSGLIYSGADDYAVHVWRMEAQKERFPPRDKPMVGYTQKQSAQWKRKNKKKKINQNSSPAPNKPATPTHRNGTPTNTNVDSSIEALLESKKAQLLAEMNLDSKQEAEPTETDRPTDGAGVQGESPSEGYDAGAVEEVLAGLSEKRVQEATERESGSNGKRRQIKNLFPLSVTLDNRKKIHQQHDCIDIAKHRADPENHRVNVCDPSNVNMGFYSDRSAAYRMFHQEEIHLQETNYFNCSYMLKLWKGDIGAMIDSAIENNDLTDQLVSLAPMAGYEVWRKAAEAFVQQLTNDGCFIHASQYLLACDKTEEAIVLLRQNKHYREAVALARARLPNDDPILVETVRVWAKKLQYGGSYELAAKCFASIGDHVTAAKSLATRCGNKSSLGKDELQSLFAASAVALAAGDRTTSHAYARQAITSVCMRTGKWKGGGEAVDMFGPEMTIYRIILLVHEDLVHQISSSVDDFLVCTFSEPECNDATNQDLSKTLPNILGESVDYIALLDQLNEFSASSDTSSSLLTPKQMIYQFSVVYSVLLLCVLVESAETKEKLDQNASGDWQSSSKQKSKEIYQNSFQNADKILKSNENTPKITSVLQTCLESLNFNYEHGNKLSNSHDAVP